MVSFETKSAGSGAALFAWYAEHEEHLNLLVKLPGNEKCPTPCRRHNCIYPRIRLCPGRVERWASYATTETQSPQISLPSEPVCGCFESVLQWAFDAAWIIVIRGVVPSGRRSWCHYLQCGIFSVWAWLEAEGTSGKHYSDPVGIINQKCWHMVILAMPFGELKQSGGISAPVEHPFMSLIFNI